METRPKAAPVSRSAVALSSQAPAGRYGEAGRREFSHGPNQCSTPKTRFSFQAHASSDREYRALSAACQQRVGGGRGPEKSFQPQGRLWGESWRRSFPAVGPRRVPWCFYTSVGRSRGGECRHMHARVWEPHCTPMYTLHTCNSDVTAPSARPGLSLLSKSEHVTAQRSPATSGLRVPR